MKKIMLFVTIIAVVFFSSCSSNDTYKRNDTAYIINQMDKIVYCFDEKDKDALKEMLSEQLKSKDDIDVQIQTAFELYRGKSVGYDYNRTSPAGIAMDNSICVDEHFRPQIKNIITDTEDTYSISFCEYTIYEKDKSQIGIIYINLVDSDGNLLSRIM